MTTEMERLLIMQEEKVKIESRINEHSTILINNNTDMKEPLIDSEGYPRSDIDIYQVRHARQKIICLQNDYKLLMIKIEKSLETVHKEAKMENIDPNGTNASTSYEELTPFGLINQVDSGSPSDIDGLAVNDLICKFGSVTISNFRNLGNVGEVVHHSKNKQIQVTVLRGCKEKTIFLTPRSWSGRGLLGCNIIPWDKPDR